MALTPSRPNRRLLLGMPVMLMLALAGACRGTSEDLDGLQAQRAALERQVGGLRAVVTRLSGGEPLIPAGDIAVGIDEQLVSDLITAQLPVSVDVDRYHVDLSDVDLQFRGSPLVHLRGRIALRNQPTITATVTVLGALDALEIHEATSTLRGTIAVDHLAIERDEGIGQFLAGAALDEVTRRIQAGLTSRLPTIQIPVKVQQRVDVPAQTDGVVRIAAASFPLAATLSVVTAARGQLWIGVHLEPGDIVRGQAPQ